MNLKSRITGALLPKPVDARHAEYSMLFSSDDEPHRHTERLLDVALAAVQAARKVDVSSLSSRVPTGIRFAEVWPGEHYKLLGGLVKALGAKNIVEIGTATGLSALTLMLELPAGVGDPELEPLKLRYRAEFKLAFAAALEGLEPALRAAVRQVYAVLLNLLYDDGDKEEGALAANVRRVGGSRADEERAAAVLEGRARRAAEAEEARVARASGVRRDATAPASGRPMFSKITCSWSFLPSLLVRDMGKQAPPGKRGRLSVVASMPACAAACMSSISAKQHPRLHVSMCGE
jgi:hypothetical protein